MPDGPVIEVPHGLGRDEARRRLQARIGELPQHVPGGLARMEASWPTPYRLLIHVTALGQPVDATLDIEERIVRVMLVLPPLLSFMSGPISAVIRQRGAELLLDDRRG